MFGIKRHKAEAVAVLSEDSALAVSVAESLAGKPPVQKLKGEAAAADRARREQIAGIADLVVGLIETAASAGRAFDTKAAIDTVVQRLVGARQDPHGTPEQRATATRYVSAALAAYQAKKAAAEAARSRR